MQLKQHLPGKTQPKGQVFFTQLLFVSVTFVLAKNNCLWYNLFCNMMIFGNERGKCLEKRS